MKAPAFDYQRPASLEQALALMREHGPEAQALAGGQSLMPLLAMRLSRPSVLVDINRLAELRGIRTGEGRIRVGALTRYVELETSAVVRRSLPLVARALPHVAHVAVRNRGTLGGSLALADPAAEMPACALAMDADIVLARDGGVRVVKADEYFQGPYETAREPDELLTEVRYPEPQDGERAVFAELSRRRGDFAIVGVAGRFRLIENRFASVRLVLFGCMDRPVLAQAVAAALDGKGPTDAAVRAAAQAVADDIAPADTIHAGAGYKLAIAKVLIRRAVSAGLDQAEAA